MTPRRRLVYIINSFDIGGAEVGMCRLLSELDQNEYDVTVVALSGQSNEIRERIPAWINIIDLSFTDSPSFPAVRDFLGRICSADVIVGSLYHSSIVARMMGLLNWRATIATWQHSERFTSVARKHSYRLTAGLSDVVLADSESVAEMLVEDLGLPRDIVQTVPIAGIDLNEFSPVSHTETTDITVGTVARLMEAKNPWMVLDVAERLADTRITFEIAGGGELYDDLQKAIRERNLTNVALLGRIDNVPSFLATLDIYFQPSRWEGLCITVLEAMAAGLPVVGSDVGGISKNIRDEVNGLLYNPDDTTGFVTGIETLSKSADLRNRLGSCGREYVAQGYTRSNLATAFTEAIGPE